MTRGTLAALLLAIIALMSGAFAAPRSSAQGPDIAELTSRIDAAQLRARVAAIDEPRNAFVQPARLMTTANYIRTQLDSYGYHAATDDVPYQTATFPNVTADLRGTSCPDRVFVIGGHYDSVATGPGADDASGTSGMLEIARVLADTPLPATVRFASFAMEEEGLIGSSKMAGDLSAQHAQVIGMMSLEMIGYTSGPGKNFLAVVGNTASIRLTDAVHRATKTYTPGFPVAVINLEGNGEQQPGSRRSDHAMFWDAGYQALLVTDTANFRNPNYDQPGDTIDTLDFDFMTKSVKAMLASTVEYLTYDGNHDGEADVCSGPLAATPTPGTPATAAPSAITFAVWGPETTLGSRGRGTEDWPPLWVWLAIGGAVLIGSATLAVRLRR